MLLYVHQKIVLQNENLVLFFYQKHDNFLIIIYIHDLLIDDLLMLLVLQHDYILSVYIYIAKKCKGKQKCNVLHVTDKISRITST